MYDFIYFLFSGISPNKSQHLQMGSETKAYTSKLSSEMKRTDFWKLDSRRL